MNDLGKLSIINNSDTIELVKGMLANEGNLENKDPYLVAQAYAKIYTEINQRLKKCRDLLSNGMRVQAFAEAEKDPLLLDISEELRLIEKMGWRRLCVEKKMDMPKDLNVDALAELKAAYQDESYVSQFLPELRAASNRGNNKECVRLLRQIARKDSKNPEWHEDLKEFELAYIQEIRKEFQTLKRKKHTDEIKALYNELKKPWHIPVDNYLREEVKTFIQQQEQENNKKTANHLIKNINDAYEQKNFQRLSEFIESYRELEQNEFFQKTQSLTESCDNALQWYQEELKKFEEKLFYEQKIREIEQKIQQGAPEGIDHLIRELEISGCPVPDHLKEMAQKLMDEAFYQQEKTKKNKRFLYSFMAISAVFIICCVLVFFYLGNMKNSTLENLEAAFQAEQLTLIEELISEMKGSPAFFFSSSLIQEQEQKARDLEEKLKINETSFNSLIKQLETIKNNGFYNPGNNTDDLIAKARKNAKDEADFKMLSEIEDAWKVTQNDNMLNVLTHLKSELESAESLSAADFMEIEKHISNIKKLKNEGMQIKYCSVALQEEFAQVKEKAEHLESLSDQQKNQLQKIREAPTLEDFLQELQKYIQASGLSQDSIAESIDPERKKLYTCLIDPAKNVQENPFRHPTSEQYPEKIKELLETIKQKEYTDLWECRLQESNNGSGTYFCEGEPAKIKKEISLEPTRHDSENKAIFDVYKGEFWLSNKKDRQPKFMPEELTPSKIREDTIQKMPHCDIVQKSINTIQKSTDLESVIVQTISLLGEPSIENPVLKFDIINILHKTVIEQMIASRNFAELNTVSKKLKEFDDFRKLYGYIHWLCTQHPDYPKHTKKAQSIIDEIRQKQLLNRFLAEYKLRKLFAERGMKWVGSVDLKDSETLHIRPDANPGEIWVARGDTTHPKLYLTQENGRQFENWDQGKYIPGEPLFAPEGNQSTIKLINDVIKSCDLPSAKTIHLPGCWPINL